MKKYLTMIAAAALTLACSNDDATMNETSSKGDPVIFSAAAEKLSGVSTRAGNEIKDAEPLAAQGFGVFAFYTGKLQYSNATVSPDYMWNQKVTGTGTAPDFVWSYAPVKYWPSEENEMISFFAYAPYQQFDPNNVEPTDDDQCIFGMSRNVDLGDAWISYRLAPKPWGTNLTVEGEYQPKQIDLLYGVKRTGTDPDYTYAPWVDQKKADHLLGGTDTNVKFQFEHALACIGDVIRLKMSDELNTLIDGYSTITINKMTIDYKNFTYKAKLMLNPTIGTNSVEPNWKEIISGELTTDRQFVTENYPQSYSSTALSTLALSTSYQEISKDQGLFYIPMKIGGTEDATITISLDYTITITAVGTELTGTTSSTFKLRDATTTPGEAVDPAFAGKKLGIDLVLTDKLDLLHLVYTLGGTAYEPSYSRVK